MRPVLTAWIPLNGVVGDTISIVANPAGRFGAAQGSTGHVYFEGNEIPVTWGSDAITFTVPDNVSSNSPEIYVVTAGGESNHVNLNYQGNPSDSGGINPT
jgi:hypothetical protein